MFDDYVYFERERQARELITASGFPAYLATLPLWGEAMPQTRTGDTSVGFAFERLLGVGENNKSEPDLYGVEAKSTASRQSQITLFTRNPTAPLRAVHQLVERYGRTDAGSIKRLNTNLIVGRRTKFGETFLTLGYDDRTVNVVSGDQGIVAYWTIADLATIVQKKLAKLMFSIAARSSNHFKFDRCHLYTGFLLDGFMNGIRTGRISVHFRVKGNIETARNRGTAFRIRRQELGLLYDHNMPWRHNSIGD